jgi:hypothetical protein
MPDLQKTLGCDIVPRHLRRAIAIRDSKPTGFSFHRGPNSEGGAIPNEALELVQCRAEVPCVFIADNTGHALLCDCRATRLRASDMSHLSTHPRHWCASFLPARATRVFSVRRFGNRDTFLRFYRACDRRPLGDLEAVADKVVLAGIRHDVTFYLLSVGVWWGFVGKRWTLCLPSYHQPDSGSVLRDRSVFLPEAISTLHFQFLSGKLRIGAPTTARHATTVSQKDE